ncbi:MAG: hypothetical protein V7K62_24630, partial [Nostoc sp.]
MEHWQFLIQEQGARSWHILESPNLEILEGQYRVLARSNLHNTDVEVRVTHSSTESVQPTRRIFKRSRRTNSEGLMAVIPFTYFQAGAWELRCSGDLMSELLGKSWQYSVQLQVFSLVAERKQRENVENSPDHSDTISENLEYTVPAEPEITLDNAIAVSAELAITKYSNPTTFVVPDEGNLEYTAPAEPEITLDNAIAVSAELAITKYSNPTNFVVPDEGNLEYTAPAEPEITLDDAIAVSAELAITKYSNPTTFVVPDEGNLEYTASAEPAITLDNAIAVSAELAITVVPDEGNLEYTAPAEPAITLDNAIAVSAELAITVVPDEGNLEYT